MTASTYLNKFVIHALVTILLSAAVQDTKIMSSST